MKILVIEPEKAPYEKEIGDDIHDMQAIVGGCIEPIYFEPKETAIAWCNDEFLLNGSQPNRIVGNVLVHGTFFVSGNYMNEYGEWDSCSLTDEQIEKYSKTFKKPIIALGKMEMADIEALCEVFEETEEPEITMSKTKGTADDNENFNKNQKIYLQTEYIIKSVCQCYNGRNVCCSRTESNGNRERQICKYAVNFIYRP